MAVLSGIDMAIGGENTNRAFKINYRGRLRGYGASNLSGGTGRAKGVKRWAGQYLGYGHTPAVFPGDSFTFTGSLDGTNGCTGAALCQAIVIRGSIEHGGPIEYMVRFRSNGALTLGAAAATDSSNPNPPDAIDMNIKWDGTDENDVRDIVLEISRKLRPYSSSDTAGIGKNVTGRLDARCMWRLYEGTPSNLQVPNANGVLKVYVTDTLFWQITNMRIDSLDDYGADHEGDDPVFGTMLAALNGAAAGAGVGSIINPATTTKWPPP